MYQRSPQRKDKNLEERRRIQKRGVRGYSSVLIGGRTRFRLKTNEVLIPLRHHKNRILIHFHFHSLFILQYQTFLQQLRDDKRR